MSKTYHIAVAGFGEGSGERGQFFYNKTTGKLERHEKQRKEVNAPVVHGDEAIDGIESPLTGEKFYSKSALRKHYKERGYIETGGAHLTGKSWGDKPEYKPDRQAIRDDVEKAMMDLKYGRVAIDEKSKQINLEEERQWESYRQRQK